MSRLLVPTRGTVYVEVTQGDSATTFEFQLLDYDGNPAPMDGATVAFSMKRKIDHVFVQEAAECTMTNPSTGEGWVKPVVAQFGTFEAQFVATYADESTLSFPNGWDLIVKVRRASHPIGD